MNVRTGRAAHETRAERLSEAVDETARRIHHGIDAAAEKIGGAAESLGERTDEFEERLRESGEKLLEDARQIADLLRRRTREHPLAACGIAFAAGLVVAKLLRR